MNLFDNLVGWMSTKELIDLSEDPNANEDQKESARREISKRVYWIADNWDEYIAAREARLKTLQGRFYVKDRAGEKEESQGPEGADNI